MRFLVDEDLPLSICDSLRQFGHEACDIRNLGMRGAKDWQVADYARKHELCLLTGDLDFANIRNYPPQDYAGLVVLKVPKTVSPAYIRQLLESFLQRKDLVGRMNGKLAIVGPAQVRIRTS